jgi:hypothetical protein
MDTSGRDTRGRPVEKTRDEIAADAARAKLRIDGNCVILRGIERDLRELHSGRGSLSKIEEKLAPRYNAGTAQLPAAEARILLAQLGSALTQLRNKALLWAQTQVGLEPDFSTRYAMVTFSALAAEYANQISTRADALLQQINDIDRRELPLSVYLQNTNPTDFLNLYAWNRASDARGERAVDRVRGIERLYADQNWSKVNTVFASGQGDVAMAFIKDDIGNWNLKSFDNDPEQLLNAYKNVGLAALSAAAELAGAAATGGGAAAAQSALSLANQVALGQSAGAPPTVAGIDIQTLHDRAAADIEALRSRIAESRRTIAAAIQTDAPELARLRAERDLRRQDADAIAGGRSVSDLREDARQAETEARRADADAADLQKRIDTTTDATEASQLTAQRDRRINTALENRQLASTRRGEADRKAAIEADLETRQAAILALETRLNTSRTRLRSLHAEAARQALAVLEQHRRLLDLMQEGVARSQSTGSTADRSAVQLLRGRGLPPGLPSQ